MDLARIAALLAPFLEGRTLPEVQLQQISTYIDLLLRWNARTNLTAIRTPEEIVTRHFGESLFLAQHLFPRATSLTTGHWPRTTAIDIGSGAGFPGLPIRIWSHAIHMTLVESHHKKATFLREVIRALTLTNVNVITARAETLPPAQADLVTLRAVEHFETILPIASRHLAPAGRLALLITSRQLATLASLSYLKWAAPISIPQSEARVLAISVPS